MELSNMPSRLLRIVSAPRQTTNPHLDSWHRIEPVLVLAPGRIQFRHMILVEPLASGESRPWLFQRIASALAPPQHPLFVLFIIHVLRTLNPYHVTLVDAGPIK